MKVLGGERRIHRLFTANAAGTAERLRGIIPGASSAKTICPACVLGPSKIDGHPGLRVQALGSSNITFTCLHCDTVWSRSYVKDATYAWEQVASTGTGIFMPGVAPRSPLKRREGK